MERYFNLIELIIQNKFNDDDEDDDDDDDDDDDNDDDDDDDTPAHWGLSIRFCSTFHWCVITECHLINHSSFRCLCCCILTFTPIMNVMSEHCWVLSLESIDISMLPRPFNPPSPHPPPARC